MLGGRTAEKTLADCFVLFCDHDIIPTEPSPPMQIDVFEVSSESLSIRWETPPGEVESYVVTCCSDGEIVQQLTTDTNTLTVSNLKPGVCYSLQISAQLRNERTSKLAIISTYTSK